MDGDIDLDVRRVVIEWDESQRGRVREVACRRHEREILAELRQSNLGCIAQWAPIGSPCERCKREGR